MAGAIVPLLQHCAEAVTQVQSQRVSGARLAGAHAPYPREMVDIPVGVEVEAWKYGFKGYVCTFLSIWP